MADEDRLVIRVLDGILSETTAFLFLDMAFDAVAMFGITKWMSGIFIQVFWRIGEENLCGLEEIRDRRMGAN